MRVADRGTRYEDIQIVGAESICWKEKYKLTHGARLKLLRRSLRSNPQAAAIVRSLKVPAQPVGMRVESYHSLVASVVMACPNLERLVGFYPSYNGNFNRLFHALSTRQRLKQMDWVVEPAPSKRLPRPCSSSSAGFANMLTKRGAACPTVDSTTEQFNGSSIFMHHHSNWMYLNSLSIHCHPGAALPADSLQTAMFGQLPALQHLYLSNLPPSVCNDGTLMGLPPLKTLSLSRLQGITCNGLSTSLACSSGQPITTLTLRHMELSSLSVLARLLANLSDLRTLNIIQRLPPILPKDEAVWLFPYLASKTLRILHWDMTSLRPTSPASEADRILARSIAASGFPLLGVLRVPNDGDGIFQSLCRPRDKIDLPTDKFRLPVRERYCSRPSLSSDGGSPTSSGSRPSVTSSNSTGSLSNNSSSGTAVSSFSNVPINPIEVATTRSGSDLVAARLAAQSRIEAAHRTPRFFVNVVDEEGSVAEKFGIGGYIGTVGSRIRYHLLSDDGASDEKGGLVEVADMLGSCGEDINSDSSSSQAGTDGTGLATAPASCTGKWNAWSGATMRTDRKERRRWYHTERGRWQPVRLS